MKKRAPSIDEINVAGSAFTVEAVEAIVSSVGLPFPTDDDWLEPHILQQWSKRAGAAQLTQWLNDLAVDFRLGERVQAMPLPGDVSVLASQVAQAAKGLLDAIGTDGQPVRDGLGGGALFAVAASDYPGNGKGAVLRALQSVAELQHWAERLAHATRSGPRRGRGQPPDIAWKHLIERLAATYMLFWERDPGVSRDPTTQEPSGPFFRFCAGAAAHLVSHKTEEAIATAISSCLRNWKKDAN